MTIFKSNNPVLFRILYTLSPNHIICARFFLNFFLSKNANIILLPFWSWRKHSLFVWKRCFSAQQHHYICMVWPVFFILPKSKCETKKKITNLLSLPIQYIVRKHYPKSGSFTYDTVITIHISTLFWHGQRREHSIQMI